MKKIYLTLLLLLVCVVFLLSFLALSPIFEKDKPESSTEEPSSPEEPNSPEEPSSPEISYDFTKMSYTSVGDSITYGFCGDHSKPPFSYNYPNCVKTSLNMESVQNLGACGCLLARHTNPSYTSMIDKIDLIDDSADIISVFGGINDFSTFVPLGDINSTDEYTVYGALNSIALKLKQLDAFCFFITPLPLDEELLKTIDNHEYDVIKVCEAMKTIGEKYQIPVLDLYTLGNFDPDIDSFDGCHPTEEYYLNELSPLVVDFIRNNYSK